MLVQGLLLTAYVAVAAASFDGNLNYRSPSLIHAPLGINTEKVKKRMLTKRDGSYSHARNVTFTHSIASVKPLLCLSGTMSLLLQGDPFSDSVILWTRASPVMENDASNVTVEGLVPYFSHETEKYIKASNSPICVDWKVSQSPDMSGNSTSNGRAFTTSDIDYTIKVSASLPSFRHHV